jgi:hypothetical protein
VIVLVCGSRNWTDVLAIRDCIDALAIGTIVIEGGAEGADANARHFAVQRGLFVADMRCWPRHWQMFGGSAGHKRNHAMLDLRPDLVIAFQRDGSAGTQGTIHEARRRGIPVEVHTA